MRRVSRLLHGAEEGDVNMIRTAVAAGASVDSQDALGRTGAILACIHNQMDSLRYLIGVGCSVNARDSIGSTALMAAAMTGRLDCLQLLAENGARIDFKDNRGLTALHKAAANKKWECVSYLLGQGGDINHPNPQLRNMTVLMLAAAEGYVDVVQSLVQQGANLRARDDDGYTALCHAARWGHLACVKVLALHGADVTVVTAKGLTTAAVAEEQGFTAVADWLRAKQRAGSSRDATVQAPSSARESLVAQLAYTTACKQRLEDVLARSGIPLPAQAHAAPLPAHMQVGIACMGRFVAEGGSSAATAALLKALASTSGAVKQHKSAMADEDELGGEDTPVWQHHGHDGKWLSFCEGESRRIEDAYQRAQSRLSLGDGSIVELQAMRLARRRGDGSGEAVSAIRRMDFCAG